MVSGGRGAVISFNRPSRFSILPVVKGGAWLRTTVAVVCCLLVVGLGVVAIAGPMSGTWSSFIEYHQFQPVSASAFLSLFEMDYTTCGWTLGAGVLFDLPRFDDFWVDLAGTVGAVDVYSVAWFDPDAISPFSKFYRFISSLRLYVAGVNTYLIHNIQGGLLLINWLDWRKGLTTVTLAPGEIATTSFFGGWGSFGSCTLWAELRFNAAFSQIESIRTHGYDYVLERFGPYYFCDIWDPVWPIDFSFHPQETGCDPRWSGLDVIVETPFSCLDLVTQIDFDCKEGFRRTTFEVEDICLGFSWLELAYLSLSFDIQSKSLGGKFDLVLADCACFTPYLTLLQADTTITGISLQAITVEYDMGQGVAFKAGHRFAETNSWYDYNPDLPEDSTWYAFTKWGDVAPYPAFWCLHNVQDEEFFAILIDGDSCCDGLFDVWVFNWFDVDQNATAFMDWSETIAGMEVGVGRNTILYLGLSLNSNGLNWARTGFQFSF